MITLRSGRYHGSLHPSSQDFLQHRTYATESSFDSRFTLSNKAVADVQGQLGLINTSAPVLFFNHGLGDVSSRTDHACRSHSVRGITRPHLQCRVRLTMSGHSVTRERGGFFDRIVLPTTQDTGSSGAGFFRVSGHGFANILNPPHAHVRCLTSTRLLTFGSRSDKSATASLA